MRRRRVLLSGIVTGATAFLLAGMARAAITLGPNVSKVTTTSITIAFETSVATTSEVDYGTTLGSYGFTLTEPSAGTWHERTLTGLTPGTTYYYRIRCGDGSSAGDGDASYHFLTMPDSGDAFTFIAYGDSRTFPASHASVISAMAAKAPEARLVVTVGDYTDNGTNRAYWNPQFFDVIKPLSRFIPFYTVLGNHEFDAANYYNLLALPSNGAGTPEQYYSFDYLNCHFANLYVQNTGDTSCNAGTPQYNWLVSDLGANQGKAHRFVVLHSPPYSSGSGHGSDVNLQNQLRGVFQSNHVDAVFAGHDHDYERSYPLTNGTRDDVNGVTYFVTGAGGAPLYTFTGSPAWSAFRDNQNYSFTKVAVRDSSVMYSQIAANGTVLDTFGTDSAASFSFGWVTDTHFGLSSYGGETLTPGPWLAKALIGLEQEGVRFILHGGDAIETAGTAAQFNEFDAAMKPSAPWFAMAGNHDIGDPPGSMASVTPWLNRHYGVGANGYYGFVFKNAAFYVIDSVSERSPDATVRQRFADQIPAMDAFFTANENVPIKIVCGHIPLFNQTRGEADASTNIAKIYRDQILAVMDAHQVHYYLAGHRHLEDAATDGGITVYTQTSLSFQLGTGSHRSYYVFTVTDSGLQRQALLVDPPSGLPADRWEAR